MMRRRYRNLVGRHRPSVNVLFESVAKYVGGNGIGVIMTGMGSDGTEGCKILKQQRAPILVQDKESCVVYGMPYKVTEAGLADYMASLNSMADKMTQLVAREKAPCS